MDKNYKGIGIFSHKEIKDFWTKPIDWLDNLGMLVPCQVRLRHFEARWPKAWGRYARNKNMIVIYHICPEKDITLLHELIHAWQQTEGRIVLRQPRDYNDYLTLPHEIEANWWANEYSKEIHGKETIEARRYRERGLSSLFSSL